MADNSILVAGSLHYDIVFDAPHLPAVDETVMGGPVRFVCGGKGGNQAVAAALHGSRVAMVARIGNDWFGSQLRQDLIDAGVDISQVQADDSAASGMSVAIVDQQADYGAVVASGANQTLDPDGIDLPGNMALLLLQNEVPEAVNLALAKRAKAAEAVVVLNAAPMREMNPALLATVDILIVNRVEAQAHLMVDSTNRAQLKDCLEERDTGPERVIVTLGADGLISHRIGQASYHHPSFEVETHSTHGAGDHFIGALAAGLVAGSEFERAIDYAQAAAALFVAEASSGRSKPDIGRIEAMLAKRRSD